MGDTINLLVKNATQLVTSHKNISDVQFDSKVPSHTDVSRRQVTLKLNPTHDHNLTVSRDQSLNITSPIRKMMLRTIRSLIFG